MEPGTGWIESPADPADLDSQDGPEHGNGVVPEPAAPGPTRHHFSADLFGFGDVAFLPLPHVGRQ